MNLDQVTIEYINNTFTPNVKFEMQRAFELFELFSLQYYEDKYVQLLSNENIEPMNTQDRFYQLIITDVKAIINNHALFVTDESSLHQLNELLSAIYLIQNLEDYSMIEYRLSSLESPEKVLADIFSYITHFETYDYLSFINGGAETFLGNLKEFLSNVVTDELYNPSENHKQIITNFKHFIGEVNTIGFDIIENGVNIDISLQQLVSLIPTDLHSILDNLCKTNPVQAALEIITLIYISRDNYQLPLVSYKKNIPLFLTNAEYVTKLEPVIIKIVSDFNSYHFAKVSADKHQSQQIPKV